jgi:VanZ family protein
MILVAALAVITHLATTPQQYPVFKHVWDKASHIAAFYVLALLIDFSFPKTNLGVSKIIVLLTYGVLIEVIQSFIPNRTPSLLDLVADGIGIASYRFSPPVLKRVPILRRRWNTELSTRG